MGVDLTLMPLLQRGGNVSHELLLLERRSELWSEIEAIQRPFGRDVTCFLSRGEDGEPRYGDLGETPYGDPLTFVTAGELLTLQGHEAVKDNWRNRGIWMLLSEMPADWPIVLYWH
ncbi:MAG: hypothetical protein RIC14_05755 [Filomicrobium sp.]